MIRMFVRHKVRDYSAWHKVRDYSAWRKGYGDFEPARIKLGARGHGVLRDVEDGNDVTAWHDFETIEAAKAFVNSSELKAAMQAAGVVGAPAIWFTHHALP